MTRRHLTEESMDGEPGIAHTPMSVLPKIQRRQMNRFQGAQRPPLKNSIDYAKLHLL